ncbi:MAG TPA: hypothetical protein VMW95_00285, partial [Desulfobacterales bacterium]|nr:hypothetical protein [Desulfobacterales bacterium]
MADIQITLDAKSAITDAGLLDKALIKLEASAKGVKDSFKKLKLSLGKDPIMLTSKLHRNIAFTQEYKYIKNKIQMHSASNPILLTTKITEPKKTQFKGAAKSWSGGTYDQPPKPPKGSPGIPGGKLGEDSDKIAKLTDRLIQKQAELNNIAESGVRIKAKEITEARTLLTLEEKLAAKAKESNALKLAKNNEKLAGYAESNFKANRRARKEHELMLAGKEREFKLAKNIKEAIGRGPQATPTSTTSRGEGSAELKSQIKYQDMLSNSTEKSLKSQQKAAEAITAQYGSQSKIAKEMHDSDAAYQKTVKAVEPYKGTKQPDKALFNEMQKSDKEHQDNLYKTSKLEKQQAQEKEKSFFKIAKHNEDMKKFADANF